MMESTHATDSQIGSATSITLPGTSSFALNADEHASTPLNRTRTGFPKQDGQSLSYWLQQAHCDPLLDYRTTEQLPKYADTVIVGSGITGTLVAKHHLETWPSKNVIVLEAREFCSGASGRNAGHCKPDQWRHYGKFEQAYGQEQALKVMKNESDTWKALVAYVKANNVDCDLWVGDTLDVPLDEEAAKVAKELFEGYRNAGGEVDHIKVTYDPTEAARISKLKSAKACYASKASTLHPWNLTAHIMRTNLDKGVNLQTHTLATSITKAAPSPHKWTVHTTRGDIACTTIVHATNAYTAALEPSLKGLVTPKPHICTLFIPPQALRLHNSYAVLQSDGIVHSINPRCNADGTVLFGGSNAGQKNLDKWAEQGPERCVDDSLANVEGVMSQVRSLVNDEFIDGENATYASGEGVQGSWSGILGLSADGVSFVGELPEKQGQWVCVGHHGQ
jgi:glycine/D-amino acid oxidase-like deaminating enzyme